MTKTKIEWCSSTWNPVWGCKNKCSYCYARKLAWRFGTKIYKNEAKRRRFEPIFVQSNFDKPFPKK